MVEAVNLGSESRKLKLLNQEIFKQSEIGHSLMVEAVKFGSESRKLELLNQEIFKQSGILGLNQEIRSF
jgi:hypothetical protein